LLKSVVFVIEKDKAEELTPPTHVVPLSKKIFVAMNATSLFSGSSTKPTTYTLHLSEGYGFQYYKTAQPTAAFSITSSAWMSKFGVPLLIFLLFWVSWTNGFRAFLRRIRSRRLSIPKRNKPKHAELIVDEKEDVTNVSCDEDEDMPSSPSSLRETSRILLQVATEKGFDLLPFNFSTEGDEGPTVEEIEYEPDYDADVVHICFLVHGMNGMSKDLSYLKRAMTQTAIDRREEARKNNSTRHDVVLYAPACNELRTTDGVVAGGERLVLELHEMINQEMEKRLARGNRTEPPSITLSFVGNSLGGLYSRYVIAKLVDRFCVQEAGTPALILDGKYRVFLNTFCTTATPHLGVASHTFIRIPRTAEVGVAHAMGQTGRDIFRVNDLLCHMAIKSHYISPLKQFKRRVAYANAYGTDFPVPVHTAAFLNHESDYPHHFAEDGDLQELLVKEHSDLHIATMHTPAQHNFHSDLEFDQITAETIGGDQELVIMSRSLDALGWKKVFVDPRKIVPKLSNPIRKTAVTALARLNLSSSSGSDGESLMDSDHEEESSEHSHRGDDDDEDLNSADISRLKARGVARSREIFQAVTAPPEASEQPFHWPFGHNMIVAMSRNSVYTYLNKAGRPIVDALATQLVDDIVTFEEESLVPSPKQ